MSDVDRHLTALASHQHGVFTREQARGVGVSSSAVSKRIARGALIVVGGTTLRLPGQDLTWHGRLTAGLLELGPSALVTGAAAAQLLELDGFDNDDVEFHVPRSLRRRQTIGRVSSSESITRLDRIAVDDIQCTSATRTVVEILRTGTREEAGRALDSACLKRLTAHSAVRRRLDELGRQGRPGVATFEELTRVGVVESWLERRFVEVLERFDLPVPTLQQRHQLPGVGIARVDFEYPLWRVIVEVGGRRGYLSVDERRRQERRRNALQLEGRTIYFFTHDDVVADEHYVVDTVRSALGIEPTRASRPKTA